MSSVKSVRTGRRSPEELTEAQILLTGILIGGLTNLENDIKTFGLLSREGVILPEFKVNLLGEDLIVKVQKQKKYDNKRKIIKNKTG